MSLRQQPGLNAFRLGRPEPRFAERTRRLMVGLTPAADRQFDSYIDSFRSRAGYSASASVAAASAIARVGLFPAGEAIDA